MNELLDNNKTISTYLAPTKLRLLTERVSEDQIVELWKKYRYVLTLGITIYAVEEYRSYTTNDYTYALARKANENEKPDIIVMGTTLLRKVADSADIATVEDYKKAFMTMVKQAGDKRDDRRRWSLEIYDAEDGRVYSSIPISSEVSL